MTRRIDKGVTRGAPVALEINGESISAAEGETLATVLLTLGETAFYRTRSGRPRMAWCNMGACFECRVLVEAPGPPRWRLACQTPVAPGMRVRTGIDPCAHFGGGDAAD